ncbi:exocyst complex component 8 [Condylostylus longicornis]|uniref:exocyst complex component 8 n=1 Tax=Condylostylus longicornis TaxID=2530218 RepID=UPI00244DE5AC|nr:exocyst complex component 8 [Condylostylus longicornis]
MTDNQMKIFNNKDFRPEKYIQNLVQECVGGSELQQKKQQIQEYSEQTSSSLKKYVYANYMQFIETANEIQHLESEMNQLSHILLIEQRNLLSCLGDGNSQNLNKEVEEYDQESSSVDESSQQAIRSVKELVQGFNSKVLEGKTFLNDGALIELDSNDYRPIQRVFFFLFNDTLIVCKIRHDKKLEFISQYDPRKIAVINIKDLDGVKNAINTITTDGSKIFQCISTAAKNEWIEKFEIALKFNQQLNQKSKKGQTPPPASVQKQSNSLDNKSITSDITGSPTEENNSVTENWAPDWLAIAPEEIQSFIAQRHFEEALNLIQKSEEYIAYDSTFWNASEISGKIKNLKTSLSNVLIEELSNCQVRSLQAALRSSRRPLKLLAEMGKARQACGKLLKVCSNAIRMTQREARRNNAEISELFFCDLSQVVSEFLRAFSNQPACVSSLVVWCNTELRYFSNQLIKHYLTKGSQLENVAKCVEGVRKPCAKLTEIGLDLGYHVEGLLRSTLEQIIEDSRYRLLDTIGRSEDTWQPYNLQTKTNLKNLLREMEGFGIDLRNHVTGDTWINLTQCTVNFCRHFLSVNESCAFLAKNEALKMSVEILLRDLFLAQHAITPNSAMTVDLNFVTKNKNYLLQELLPTAIDKYEKISGRRNDFLCELRAQFGGGPPKPKPRSIYQTDVI